MYELHKQYRQHFGYAGHTAKQDINFLKTTGPLVYDVYNFFHNEPSFTKNVKS